MANSQTVTDDWNYYVTSLMVNAQSGKVALKVVIYSDKIRIAQEFHLCTRTWADTTSEYVFNQLYEGGGDKYSLYSLRGRGGRIDLDSEHLQFSAFSKSGAPIFANEMKLNHPHGDYWYDGMWLLYRVVNYADMSHMMWSLG